MNKAVGVTQLYCWSPVTGLGYPKRPGWAICPHSASLIDSYQREHYKLDWHRFNLKQRLKDKPLLSALDFEKQSSTGDVCWETLGVGVEHGGGGRPSFRSLRKGQR